MQYEALRHPKDVRLVQTNTLATVIHLSVVNHSTALISSGGTCIRLRRTSRTRAALSDVRAVGSARDAQGTDFANEFGLLMLLFRILLVDVVLYQWLEVLELSHDDVVSTNTIPFLRISRH